MRRGLPSRVDDQVFWRMHETQRRGVEHAVGLARLAGPIRRRDRFGERRLVAERARRIHRAQQQLQQVQRAAGVEAVAVRADAAHRVHRHRAADASSACSRPYASVQAIGNVMRVVESGFGQLARDAADGVGGNAATFADRIGRVLRIEIAFGDQMEYRHRAAAVGQGHLADHRGRRRRWHRRRAARRALRSQHSGLPSASRANRPSSAPCGLCITSQCALV